MGYSKEIFSSAADDVHEKSFEQILYSKHSKISYRNIVAQLCSVDFDISHCVLIYGCDEKFYKIKDSWGTDYKIPKCRPTYDQARHTKMASEIVGFENFKNMVNSKLRNEIDLAKVQLKSILIIFISSL